MNSFIISSVEEIVNNVADPIENTTFSTKRENSAPFFNEIKNRMIEFKSIFSILLNRISFVHFNRVYIWLKSNTKINASIIYLFSIDDNLNTIDLNVTAIFILVFIGLYVLLDVFPCYLKLLVEKCSNNNIFYSLIGGLRSTVDISYINNVNSSINFNKIIIINNLFNGIFYFVKSLKRINSKDLIIKCSWLPFNFEINLEEKTNFSISNIIFNFNFIFILLIFFSFIALYRYRYFIWILINSREKNFSVNKFVFMNKLNGFYYLRYILFSSFFVLYFIYAYINLNIDFKEMYKLFDLLFSKNTMLIDYVNNKFGLNIYFMDNTDPLDNNNLGTNIDTGNPVNNSPNFVNPDGGNQDNNPPTPVNIDNLPKEVRLEDYPSDTENSDNNNNYDEEDKYVFEKMKEDLENNPEYVDTVDRIAEYKRTKIVEKSVLKESINILNNDVKNMNKILETADIVEEEIVDSPDTVEENNVDSSETNNAPNNESDSDASWPMSDDDIERSNSDNRQNTTERARTVREAYFTNEKNKNDFLVHKAIGRVSKETVDMDAVRYNKAGFEIVKGNRRLIKMENEWLDKNADNVRKTFSDIDKTNEKK